MCFILEGYSQGAAATVNALSQLTGASFTAVKGVFLIGDPQHKSGLACNVDQNGGTTTKNVNGLSAYGSSGIPSNWVSKTLDVCNYVSTPYFQPVFSALDWIGLLTFFGQGDGVCDTTHGYGINQQHLAYSTLSSVQNLGTTFVVGKLRGTS